MIKVETKMGTTDITVDGDLTMLRADTCSIVRSILRTITEENKIAGQEYEKFVRKDLATLVLDGVPKPEDVKHKQVDDKFVKVLADVLIAVIIGSES